MNDKKINPVNYHQASLPNQPHFLEEMRNAAVMGGNAMASSEPFGPVIGAGDRYDGRSGRHVK